MPFQYVLANLLSNIRGAFAVAFLDGEGETVSLITRQDSPEELRVFGAYHGIFLKQLRKILKDDISFFYYRTEKISCYCNTVGEEYIMVVVTSRHNPIALVQREMLKAKKEIEEHAL